MSGHPSPDRHVTRQAKSARWLLACAVLALSGGSGCVVGPDYARPRPPVPDLWHQQLENGAYIGKDELGAWWTQFNDPLFDELIVRSDNGNLDLYAAYTRILQARAELCVTRAPLFPFLDGTGSFETRKGSQNSFNIPVGAGGGNFRFLLQDLWTTGLNSSWEPDVFGRILRQVQAADARLYETIESYRDILVSLHGDLALRYTQVRTTQERLNYVRQNVEIQRKSLELAERRVEGGVAPVLDRYQAQSSLASTEAAIPPLEAELHRALNGISVLLGEYPGTVHALLAEAKPVPQPPATLPLVLPIDMVRQRPDIRAAEREIAARTAEVGVAVADLYPQFTLNGTVGVQSLQLGSLFENGSLTYSVGPAFRWPIFQAGRIRCNIRLREAAVEEAIATYEQTILRAFQEVEDSIIDFNKERIRQQKLREAVKANQSSLGSVLELYRAGKTNFQNVLDTQQRLAISQDNLATTDGLLIGNLVVLYRALGGGWTVDHHLPDRVVRLGYPDRAAPDVVERESREDAGEQYFQPPESSGPDRFRANDAMERLPRPGADTGNDLDPAGDIEKLDTSDVGKPGDAPPPPNDTDGYFTRAFRNLTGGRDDGGDDE